MYERRDLKRRRECVRTESENIQKMTPKWDPKTVAKHLFLEHPGLLILAGCPQRNANF